MHFIIGSIYPVIKIINKQVHTAIPDYHQLTCMCQRPRQLSVFLSKMP